MAETSGRDLQWWGCSQGIAFGTLWCGRSQLYRYGRGGSYQSVWSWRGVVREALVVGGLVGVGIAMMRG